MATTATLLSLARKKLLEESTEILDDTTLLTYADFAQQDIVKRVYPKNSIVTTTLTFTNGEANVPADFGTLYTDGKQNTYNFFPEVSYADFLKVSEGNALTIQGGKFKVFPTTTASMTIAYYPSYPALSLVVNPTIDAYFHECIVYGILARAYEDLQDPELAQFYANKYESLLKQKMASYSLYEEGAVRGGQMFNEIRIVGGGYYGPDPNYW